MVKNKSINESSHISELAVYGIQEKKGNDIIRLDLRNIHSSVADYFVICTADSDVQVKAIADAIMEGSKKEGERPWHKEGLTHKTWVLLDYVEVVVHIFLRETRSFYSLEKLWGDAEITEIKD